MIAGKFPLICFMYTLQLTNNIDNHVITQNPNCHKNRILFFIFATAQCPTKIPLFCIFFLLLFPLLHYTVYTEARNSRNLFIRCRKIVILITSDTLKKKYSPSQHQNLAKENSPSTDCKTKNIQHMCIKMNFLKWQSSIAACVVPILIAYQILSQVRHTRFLQYRDMECRQFDKFTNVTDPTIMIFLGS